MCWFWIESCLFGSCGLMILIALSSVLFLRGCKLHRLAYCYRGLQGLRLFFVGVSGSSPRGVLACVFHFLPFWSAAPVAGSHVFSFSAIGFLFSVLLPILPWSSWVASLLASRSGLGLVSSCLRRPTIALVSALLSWSTPFLWVWPGGLASLVLGLVGLLGPFTSV